ncbi:hypothetical protein BDV95DRAFT_542848 [Massariosphaeria phaeospora]|uniref:BTB domain-containing protein n=1 Tax=Massariosphaeria phaeospora TaxID=100035 RepID=A0A7C8M7B6_9PLEO|nr:hypothetical protein BDV95DRAFT_542848 [Massariosphaeria phaeospora]
MADNAMVYDGELAVSDFLKPPLVIVKVGPDAKEYHIHKELLMYCSGFFRGALSSEAFKSAQDGVIVLEDVETPTFDAFTDWLYGQKFPQWEIWELWYTYPDRKHVTVFNMLILWYVFADRFLVPAMKKTIVHAATKKIGGQAPHYEYVDYAWANLPPNSPFLQLIVDFQAECWTPGFDTNNGEEVQASTVPQEFFYRVMKRMGWKRDNGNISAIRQCYEYDELERGGANEASDEKSDQG